MASSPSPTDCESQHSEARLTRGGRRIIYGLKVKQDPQKARACGQGAKSSTDRRPVDPPPIVALTIHEEEEDGNRKDVTYTYRANFFMFASLENARPIAQGRGMSRDSSTAPILCGAPVSGISYLDRPEQAGYFIFPDLSVRQEGRYRLCFTLYEELRDSSMDDRYGENASPELQMEHVCARCIVRTNPFTVYSAKKFPGLSESTSLSRTVAEQGCRVRIRRDVRMRKRETKSSKQYGSDDEDADPPKAQEPDSPDMKPAGPAPQTSEPISRPASTSGTPFQISRQRVHASDSQAQYEPPQYSSVTAPQPPHSYPGAQQHQSAPSHVRHYDQSPMPAPYGQQQYSHHQSMAQSPHHQMSGFPPPPQMPYAYQNQQYFPYQQHYGYMPHQQMQTPGYPIHRHDSMNYVSSPQDYQAAPGSQYHTPAPPQSSTFPHHSDPQSRSTSLSGPPTASLAPNGLHHAQPTNTATSPAPSHLSSQQDSQTGHGHGKHNLPPIQTHHPHQPPSSHPLSHPLPSHRPTYDSPHPHPHQQHPHSALNPSAPSFYPPQGQHPQPHYHQHDLPSHLVPPPPQYITPASAAPTSSKRSYASTFDTQHLDARLQSGARPNTNTNTNGLSHTPFSSHQQVGTGSTAWAYPDSAIGGNASGSQTNGDADADADGSDGEDMEPMMMAYRRADGTVREMKWPLGH